MKKDKLLSRTNIYHQQAYKVFRVILRKCEFDEHELIDASKTVDNFFSGIIGVFDNNFFDVKIKCAFLDAVIEDEKGILRSDEHEIIYEKTKVDIDEISRRLIRTKHNLPVEHEELIRRELSEKDKQELKIIELIRKGIVIRLHDYKNEINNNHIKKRDIEHPFSNQHAIEAFEYIDEWFKDTGKSKYSYIFNFMKDRKIDTQLKQRLYFNWIFQDPNNKDRLISTAESSSKYLDIEELYERFLKSKSS